MKCHTNRALGGVFLCPYLATPSGNGYYCHLCGPSKGPASHITKAGWLRRKWRRVLWSLRDKQLDDRRMFMLIDIGCALAGIVLLFVVYLLI